MPTAWIMRMGFVMIALMMLGSLFLYLQPEYIGRIIAKGGNVTAVNLEWSEGNIAWTGLYGNLGSGDTTVSFTGAEGVVQRVDIGCQRCFTTELYASNAQVIDWDNLEVLTPSEFGTYLNVSPYSKYSPINIFTEQRSFFVGNNPMTLYSTTTNSATGRYDMGILKQGSTIVYVTHLNGGGIGFDGTPVDYQILLPVTVGTANPFHFTLDPSDPCNRLPSFSGLGDIEGYVNEPVEEQFTASDLDRDGLTLDMEPFYSFLNLRFKYSRALGYYRGNFSFTTSQIGEWHTNFLLSDNTGTVTQRVDFTIGYCGNMDSGGSPRCEGRYEDCENCPQDCGPCRDGRDPFVILLNATPCVQDTVQLFAYDRDKSGACKKSFDKVPVCSPISGAELKIYKLKKDRWHYWNTVNTDSRGIAEFRPDTQTEYKIVGDHSGYYPAFLYVKPKVCEAVLGTSVTGSVVRNESLAPLVEKPVAPDETETGWRPGIGFLLLYNTGLALVGIFLIRLIHKR